MKSFTLIVAALVLLAGCAEQPGIAVKASGSAAIRSQGDDAMADLHARHAARVTDDDDAADAAADKREGDTIATLKTCAANARKAKQDPKKACACIVTALEEGTGPEESCRDASVADLTGEAEEDAAFNAPTAAPVQVVPYYLGMEGARPRGFSRDAGIHVAGDKVPMRQGEDGVFRPICDGLEMAVNGHLVLWSRGGSQMPVPEMIAVPQGMGSPILRGRFGADVTSVLRAGEDGWIDLATMKVGARVIPADPSGAQVTVRCWKRLARVVTPAGFVQQATMSVYLGQLKADWTDELGWKYQRVEYDQFDWSRRAPGMPIE